MFKNKCPNCKSKNIIDHRWIYTFKPNSCCDCGFEWEATYFMRIFFASWILVLILVADTEASSWQFFKSNAGVVVVFGYLSLILIVPTIAWFVKPYKEWGSDELKRKAVNLSCLAAILIPILAHYTKA